MKAPKLTSLITALSILNKYVETEAQNPLYFDHDYLIITLVEADTVTPHDIKILETLGFIVHNNYFISDFYTYIKED